LANRLGLSVSEFNKRQNGKVFKQVLDIDVTTSEDWLNSAIEAFSAENAALITTLSQRHIDQVRSLVVEGFRNGTTAKNLSLEIENKVNAKTKANYRLIARDQVNKLNGQLTQLRQRSVGVTRYVWRTSLDERVRPSHRSKEGNTYQWDNPPDDTGHPGNDYQCRCYAEPILEDLLNE
jgi:SPP1 gp7 family putative phage head morphogenesis protein